MSKLSKQVQVDDENRIVTKISKKSNKQFKVIQIIIVNSEHDCRTIPGN